MNSVTACIFFVCLSAIFVSAVAAGGNLAPCRSDSNCAGERSCRAVTLYLNHIGDSVAKVTGISIENLLAGDPAALTAVLEGLTTSCGDDDDYCFCVPLDGDLIQCSPESDCLEGEQCVVDAFNICVANSLLEAVKQPKFCTSDSDCTVPDTTCVKFLDGGVCLARFRQITASEEPDSSPNTTDEESNDSDDDDDEDGDGDDSEICIAVKSLRHLQPHQLVYRKHMTAHVLCDEHGSCTTAGHMVRFRGRAMMMKSYCELVGNCERSITLVNSPRYTRALQIPSDSPDLTFTAFAARYATTAEEHVLRTAVHIGL